MSFNKGIFYPKYSQDYEGMLKFSGSKLVLMFLFRALEDEFRSKPIYSSYFAKFLSSSKSPKNMDLNMDFLILSTDLLFILRLIFESHWVDRLTPDSVAASFGGLWLINLGYTSMKEDSNSCILRFNVPFKVYSTGIFFV